MFDFPNSPTENQTFSPAGGPTYIYKAPVWTVASGPQVTQANVEILPLAPATNQNDYATGASTSKNIRSLVNLSPTVSMVLSGISTTSWEVGKCITLRNATSRTGADARCVIIPRGSALSSANNRIQYAGNRRLPLLLMPQETAEFFFDGTDLKLLNTTRGTILDNYFDHRLDGRFSGGAWTNGTGAGSTYQNGDAGGGEPFSYLEAKTGTTATGRSSFMDNSVSTRVGLNALLFLSRVQVNQLSTAAEEFAYIVGFTETGAAPADNVAWVYYRPLSTNWITRTGNNSVLTDVATTLPVAIADFPMLGFFVNGDGTRVEFFWSNDGGLTWTFTPTPHTTNIPNTSGRLFGFGTSLVKSVGITQVFARLLWCGQIGWL
jgi:hypothetical protein